jgi:hypothetical protein
MFSMLILFTDAFISKVAYSFSRLIAARSYGTLFIVRLSYVASNVSTVATNFESERPWKEAVVTHFRYYNVTFVLDLRELTYTTIRLASLRAEM